MDLAAFLAVLIYRSAGPVQFASSPMLPELRSWYRRACRSGWSVGALGLALLASWGARPAEAQLAPGDAAPPPFALDELPTEPVRSDRPSGDLSNAAELPADVAAVIAKRLPENSADLLLLQQQFQRVLHVALPATVGVELGEWSGSGVVVSPEGLVLTAGHVVGQPEQPVQFVFADGTRAEGKMLGINRQLDCGMMQITDAGGPWPFVRQSTAEQLRMGDWVIAVGQPGGFHADRSPPVRLGRVLYEDDEIINTDCTLVGGDSGGPLLDMQGLLVGIHSRIGRRLTSNFHVPIRAYRNDWNRLLAGEVWGGPLAADDPQVDRPLLGLAGRRAGDACLVTQVFPNMPAAQAGIQAGDLLMAVDGKSIASPEQLSALLDDRRPGQRVSIELERQGESKTVEVWLGRIGRPLPGGAEAGS